MTQSSKITKFVFLFILCLLAIGKEAKAAVTHWKDIFEIAPYIQQLKSNEVTVKWQTKVESSAAVVFKNHSKDEWNRKNLAEKSVLDEIILELQ